jgi:hypothetical protein
MIGRRNAIFPLESKKDTTLKAEVAMEERQMMDFAARFP